MINLPPKPPREEYEFSVGLVRELELRGLPFEIAESDADDETDSAAEETPRETLSLAAFVEGTSNILLEDWQHIICERLEKLIHQKGQRLLVHGPPQFGKSAIISQRFPAYTLGRHPTYRVRVACYNVTHAERFSKVNLELMRDPRYAEMFPDPGARVPSLCPADEWSTVARAGMRDANPSFMALGLATGFAGVGVDTLVIDDPYKNRMEARSEATNAALWGWWTDVVIPRLNPATNIVVMFHRWWERDFAGLLLEQGGWEMLRFPAIADGQPGDPTGRAIGTPLSPRYSLSYLAEVRAQQGTSFEALYQGIPYPAEGGMFKAGAVSFLDACPATVRSRARWWDVGATENGGDWTVGVRLADRGDGRYVIEDVVRGRWASHQRDRIMRETAERDGTGTDVLVPQDPGAAGKAQADAFIRLLAGFSVSALRESGDKVTRADPLASQWNAGNISLVRGPWNDAFLAEILSFDQGAHDDQVDAVSNAFNTLAGAPGLPYRWKRAAALAPAPLQGHVTEVIPAPPVHTEDEIAAARESLLRKEIAAEDQAQTSALSAAPAAGAPTLTSRQERLAAYYSSMSEG